MSLAASAASGTERSPSVQASRRTEKTTSRAFFAPIKHIDKIIKTQSDL